MTNTAAAATTAAPIKNACICSTFAAIKKEFTLGNGQPETIDETTGCTESTTREFAPGHDAKLKALLIRAGVNGWDVRQGSIASSARKAAAQFAFAYMVDAGIERGLAKKAAKADRKAARAAAPKRERATKSAQMPRPVGAHVVAAIPAVVQADEAETPAQAETVRVKIGRWEYNATIDQAGTAHYTTAAGAAAQAVKGVYKLV